MTEIEVTLSSEYGIMFLYDSNSKPIFPNDAGKHHVTYTSNCIAFTVLSYVDGDARINICGVPKLDNKFECFSGTIQCPSKSLSLCDHNGFAFASVPLKDCFASLKISSSQSRNPDVVECIIENMDTF